MYRGFFRVLTKYELLFHEVPTLIAILPYLNSYMYSYTVYFFFASDIFYRLFSAKKIACIQTNKTTKQSLSTINSRFTIAITLYTYKKMF